MTAPGRPTLPRLSSFTSSAVLGWANQLVAAIERIFNSLVSSNITSAGQVNGASIPASTSIFGSNASSQFVARSLRQIGAREVWVPIGARGRGLPGSGGNYDSTNTQCCDQSVYQAPSYGAVRAIRLGYAGFDITNMGEIDRVTAAGADQPATTLSASVTTVARAAALPTTSSIASGSTAITFTVVASGTPWNVAKKGQFVTGVSQIPTGTYVAGMAFSYSSSNTMSSVTITLSAATTGTIAAGTYITFEGDLIPATFGSLQSGQVPTKHDFIWSDPIHVSLAAGEFFAIRTYLAFSGAGFQAADYPASGGSNSSRILPADNAFQYEFSDHGTSLSDHTRTNATFSNSGYGFWGPHIILGLVNAAPPAAVLLLGDSIGAGTGDNADTYANCRRQGWFQKSLSNTLPWVSLARGSTTVLESYVSGGLGQLAAAMDTGITDVVMQYMNNDLFTGGLTAAQIMTNLQALAAPYQLNGQRVWICTALPRTYSSDGWVSQANQAFLSGASFSTTITLTANASLGATSLTVSSITSVTAGQCLSGPGIASGCVVVSASGTTVVISIGLTAAVSSGQSFVCCGAEANRRTLNSNIRTNYIALGFAGVIDLAVIVESTTFQGYWTSPGGVSWTADGVHPAPIAHTAIINAGVCAPTVFSTIPTSVF